MGGSWIFRKHRLASW